MPARPGDGEDIIVVTDIAHHLSRCVMLEEQIHVVGDATDILENRGLLHIVWVGTISVETETIISFSLGSRIIMRVVIDLHVVVVNLQNVRNLGKGFSEIRLVEMACVVVKIGMSHILFVPCRPLGIPPVVPATHS